MLSLSLSLFFTYLLFRGRFQFTFGQSLLDSGILPKINLCPDQEDRRLVIFLHFWSPFLFDILEGVGIRDQECEFKCVFKTERAREKKFCKKGRGYSKKIADIFSLDKFALVFSTTA